MAAQEGAIANHTNPDPAGGPDPPRHPAHWAPGSLDSRPWTVRPQIGTGLSSQYMAAQEGARGLSQESMGIRKG
eukprot:4367664-Alexandrium_andersonii.AAC.1